MSEPIHVETGIRIDAAPEQVWARLVDVAHYGDWNGYLVRVEGRLAAGETIQVHSLLESASGPPEPMVAPAVVVSLDPPRSMRWEGGTPDRALFKGDHWWELSDTADGGTRLRHHEYFTGSLAARIVGDGERIRRHFDRMNRDLKSAVEAAR